MPKVPVTARLPKSLWQLFHLALRRNNLTMQSWIEHAVRGGALEAGGLPPPARRMRVTSPLDPETSKQAIARVDRDDLARLQAALRESGIPFNRWLVAEVMEYVRSERLRASELLPSRIVELLRDRLPADPGAREAVAYALLNWPEDVILVAAEPSLGLQDAVRAGDAKLVSEILAVAASKVVFEARLENLRAKRRPRRPT